MSMPQRLGAFTLDAQAGALLHAGQPVTLGGRGVAVLQALVAHAPQFVSKDRIVELAWPGLVVEDSNLSVQVSAIRRALAVVPGAERWLETLPRRGYRYVGPLDNSSAPSVATNTAACAAPHSNLPELLSSFVGRQAALTEVQGLLAQSRLLTLVGTGGVGKTRLALRVAGEQLPLHPDGAWLVELASLANPDLVVQSVASVLGVKDQAGKPLLQRLIDHLGDKRTLLLLDNAEHLLEVCAKLAEALLQHCPGVRLLVTSRERLGLSGEVTYRVPSLALPAADADADQIAQTESVKLFVDRVRWLQSQFCVDAGNARVVAELCRRLDGIPLALELATGRIRSMTLDELLAHLDERFRVLTGGARTAPRRQQTLRALIDWSYDLLSTAERALLRRVSVFRGGWTLEAAEAVCADDGLERWEVLDLLAALVDKSLVTVEVRLGATRYGMLETVREYALALRSPEEQARYSLRHLDYFAQLCKLPEVARKPDEQTQWFLVLESEHDNLRSALGCATAQGGEAGLTGLKLACSLEIFWYQRGYTREGQAHVGALLNVTPDHPSAERAKALRIWGVYAYQLGDAASAQTRLTLGLDMCRALSLEAELAEVLQALGVVLPRLGRYADAIALLEECLHVVRRIGPEERQSEVLHELGSIHMVQGNRAMARQMYQETLAFMRRGGNSPKLGTVLLNLGILCTFEGEAARGRQLIEESLQLFRDFAHPMGVLIAQRMLAAVLINLGDFVPAQKHAEEALVLARQQGDKNSIAVALCLLGDVARQTGKPHEGLELLGQGLRLLVEIDHKRMINDAVDTVGYIYSAIGKPQAAIQLWAWSDAQRLTLGAPRQAHQIPPHESGLAQARTIVVDKGAFDLLTQEGQALTLEQVVGLANAAH